MKQTLLVAEGLADMIAASGGTTKLPAKFKEFVESVFPFMEKEDASTDAQLKEVMRKEAEKGPIQFTATPLNAFKNTAKKLGMPDDFKKKLQAKAAKRDK